MKVIPIEVHGDDADAHRRRTFCCVSFRSAVTRGPTMKSLFPIYVLDNTQASEHSVAWQNFPLIVIDPKP